MMQVRVLGSCVALGDFEVDKAVRLCATDDAYPVWSAETPVVVTRGYPITYRCRLSAASQSTPHICHTVPSAQCPQCPQVSLHTDTLMTGRCIAASSYI
jgi:hypothetical protein